MMQNADAPRMTGLPSAAGQKMQLKEETKILKKDSI